MLKILKRSGAATIYTAIWDIDVYDFIDLKKKNGDDRRRALESFPALVVDDVFMNRLINNQEYTLFSPYDVRDLNETFGEEFRIKYENYEKEWKENPSRFNKETKSVLAVDLFKYAIQSYYETGTPFFFFKDNVNNAHEHKHLGIIRSSNLCTEIALPTRTDRTAVCNLGSINVSKVYTEEHLKRIIKIATRAMDNAIDLTPYPSEESRLFQKEMRSIGCGFLGEAEYIATRHIEYGSDEHIEFVDKYYGWTYKYLKEASEDLAKEKGSCIVPGIRNAYRAAIAPNTSSGVLACTTSSCAPATGLLWIEQRKHDTIKMVAPNMTKDNIKYYKTAYDINVLDQIKVNCVRQKHIDMGISFDLFFRPENTTAKVIRDAIIAAWKGGMKCLYYLRNSPADNKGIEDGVYNGAKITSKNGISCVGCEN